MQRTATAELTYKFIDWNLQVEVLYSGNYSRDNETGGYDGDWQEIEITVTTEESGNDITYDLESVFLPMNIEGKVLSVYDAIYNMAYASEDWTFND